MAGHGLDTTAGKILALSPDWRRPWDWLPALSVYIAAAPVDGDTCLCLDARASELPVDVVRAMVSRAAEYLSDGRPFAEVLLIEDPVELGPPVEPVGSGGELVDRLGLTPRRLDTGSAAAVVLHARWSKALADAIQTDIDRALLDAAPPAPRDGRPLVTVRIPTFGSTELLVERAIPSALNGSYPEIELLVCSDGPQPHAREAVEAIADPRVRYIELDERPVYPERRTAFWQTAGTYAVNRLVEEARGEYIAPLDHDDAFTMDHVAMLLAALRQSDADFAYGQAMMESPQGPWGLVGGTPLAHGNIVHATVMYSRRLQHMRYDPEAWVLDEPGDWNMWRRMQAAGARMTHLPAPVAVHFKERSSIVGREDQKAVLEAAADDVLGTVARRLLELASAQRGVLDGAGASSR
jgi:hypothetical protein